MLSGLFKWIAGFQVKTQYEAALLKASYPDEYTPDQTSIQMILNTFAGKNEEIRAQVAVIQFFNMLDKGDYKSYWTFNLKMLLIMDRCLEQRLIVEDIAVYENNFLQEFSSIGHAHSSTLINGFISQYYCYIKHKAKIYSHTKSIFSLKPRDRLTQISKMSIDGMNQVIKTCNGLHNQIIKINNNYKNGNRKINLVQYVFCNLLNTALSCYTIQSICTSVLITKIPSMQFQQLHNVKAVIEQTNKTTKEIVRFIQCNKQLEGFKDMKYGQFFNFDSRVFNILEDAIKNFDAGRKSFVRDVDQEEWKAKDYNIQVSRATLSKKIYTKNTHFLPGDQRKIIKYTGENTIRQIFKNFKNIFNDNGTTSSSDATSSTCLRSTVSLGNKPLKYSKFSKFDENQWIGFKNEFS